ncbi:MmgE/PrpD family protein [Virgibacillus byunsanensis]|uniref:MmgE/PrpD family protein n=1 Tax=Virgibacillus byunsanensis TaxID=570945 RepID=A0ABW3LNF1_9BACI
MSSQYRELLQEILVKDDFSEDTIKRAKWVIMDTIVAALYGIKTEKPLQNYIDSVSVEQDIESNVRFPILGSDKFVTAKDSLVIHGTAIVSNELDEGNQFAKGHPAAHILPTIMISAIENKSSGKEFIKAFILAYEASSRLAMASNMKDYMHPHGTWGNVGATIAAGLLQRMKVDDIINASMLSATFPLATTWEAAEKGITARNLYTGLGSFIAYETLKLQSYGFRSSSHVVEDVWKNIMAEGFDGSKLFEDLFSPPLIEKNYFKFYPSCRFTHASIDAMKNLISEYDFSLEDIDRVEVKTYGLAARCRSSKPKTPLEAKFSIPFMLSAILHEKNLYTTNEESVLFDPAIQELSSKIIVNEDEELNKLLPKKRAAQVAVIFKNNHTIKNIVYTAKGEYDQPLEEDQLIEKYNAMLGKYYSKSLLKTLKDNVFHIEICEDMNEFFNSNR